MDDHGGGSPTGSVALKAPCREQGMRPSLAAWWAWILWVIVSLLTGSNMTFRIATRTGAYGEPWLVALVGDLAFFLLPTVGLVIATRRPTLIFGWLLLVAAFSFEAGELAHSYATQALLHPGTLPGGIVAAFLQSFQLIGFIVLPFLLLLFPDGRLPSPRWRLLAWAAVLCPVLMWPALFLSPGLMIEGVPASRNRYALQALEGVNLGDRLFGAWYVILLLALLSLLFRFRRARGEQRQQLKWVLFGGALFPITFFVEAVGNPTLNVLSDLVAIAAFCGAIGVAILKYRLYDIDRIINRTLVYSVLTATLGLGYASVALLLGELFGGVGAQPPSWAVAAATLAVAALFRPARRRIQAAVDRRFNRRKYNSAKTIEMFSARLRDQIDLDTLAGELLLVTDTTMQPTTLSLWLRPPHESSNARTSRWGY